MRILALGSFLALALAACASSGEVQKSSRWSPYAGCNAAQCKSWQEECSAECINNQEAGVTECENKCGARVLECQQQCPG